MRMKKIIENRTLKGAAAKYIAFNPQILSCFA